MKAYIRHPETPIGELGTIVEFWQWAMSDLLNNTNRGVLAEYIVGKLLGIELTSPRIEWDAYDLMYGTYKIEVKSSSYRQSWHTAQERSQLRFDVGERRADIAALTTTSVTKQRHADIYVFCVFPVDPDDFSSDVLDIDQWRFYTCTTAHLNVNLPSTAKSIGLAKLDVLCKGAVSASTLKTRINTLLQP